MALFASPFGMGPVEQVSEHRRARTHTRNARAHARAQRTHARTRSRARARARAPPQTHARCRCSRRPASPAAPPAQLFADLMGGAAPELFAFGAPRAASLLHDRPAAAARGEPAHLIKVDIVETPAAYILHADAPGCRKADMRVDVDDSRPQTPLLHISVSRDAYVHGRAAQPAAAADAAAAANANADADATSGGQAALVARLSPAPGDEVCFMHSENCGGRLHRTIRLPRAGLLQLDRVSCKAADGVLTITVPRLQASEVADERKTVRIA